MKSVLDEPVVRNSIDDLFSYIKDKYNVFVHYKHIKEIRYISLDTIEVKIYKPHEREGEFGIPEFSGSFTVSLTTGYIDGCGFVNS